MSKNPSNICAPVEENNPSETILDNAKRSVSIRMNTSDYGKLKLIGQRFRTRESHVFRFLIQKSLKNLVPFFQSEASVLEVCDALIENAPEIFHHFDIDKDRLEGLVNQHSTNGQSTVEPKDIELLMMLAVSDRYLAFRLGELTNREIPENAVKAELREYLRSKYSSANAAGT